MRKKIIACAACGVIPAWISREAGYPAKITFISWGRSSAGRAPRSQCGGREFDPPRLHHQFKAAGALAAFSFAEARMLAGIGAEGTGCALEPLRGHVAASGANGGRILRYAYVLAD